MKLTCRAREALLDLLLVLLVLTSLLLSVRIWYPEPLFSGRTPPSPACSFSPSPIMREMPEIFRPERVVVRCGGKPGGTARGLIHLQHLVAADSQGPYRPGCPGWCGAHRPGALGGGGGPARWSFTCQRRCRQPVGRTRCSGRTPFLRNGSILVDRVIVTLGEHAAVYLSGPPGFHLFLADLPEAQRSALAGHIEHLDPALFGQYRELVLDGLGVTVSPGLVVPDVAELPAAAVVTSMPDLREEEVRYFPDLSVVRQIDEHDARSLTDGRRLLRLTGSGLLQYRTAEASAETAAPTLERALEAAGTGSVRGAAGPRMWYCIATYGMQALGSLPSKFIPEPGIRFSRCPA